MASTTRIRIHAGLAVLIGISGIGSSFAADPVKTHPLKSFTVVYRMEGQQTGTET
jgi:hypothetical protein